jgi:hypothetical protein
MNVYSGRSAGKHYTQLVGHPDELGQRSRTHFPHNLAAMNTDRNFARTKIGGGLFAEVACDDERKHFLFTRRE